MLGLDLQGGAHLLYEVDRADVIRGMVGNLRDDLRRLLREEKSAFPEASASMRAACRCAFPTPRPRRIMPKLSGLVPLSAAGRLRPRHYRRRRRPVKLNITEAAIDNKVKRAVEQTIEVLNRRVNGLGTTEPNIQRQGNDRVLVEVPGLQDTNRLKEIVGTTAKLEFRLVGRAGANPGRLDMLDQTDQPGKCRSKSR